MDFRGELAAATLKPAAGLPGLAAAGHFRGELAAATLKRGQRGNDRAGRQISAVN